MHLLILIIIAIIKFSILYKKLFIINHIFNNTVVVIYGSIKQLITYSVHVFLIVSDHYSINIGICIINAKSVII